jgi:NHL repeat
VLDSRIACFLLRNLISLLSLGVCRSNRVSPFRRSAQMAIVGRYVFIGSALLGGSALAQNFTFTTWAGTVGSAGSADGTGSAARFNLPVGLAIDAAKNVYVVDSGNNTIRKITSVGVVTTLAGFAGGVGSTDGIGSAARFNGPSVMTVDGAGNLYVADCGNHTVRKITGGGVVTTLAGFPGASGSTDGTGSAPALIHPRASPWIARATSTSRSTTIIRFGKLRVAGWSRH